MPFLDSIRTISQLNTIMLNEPSMTGLTEAQALLVSATLAAQVGDTASARRKLDEALRRYKGKPFEATVQQTISTLAPLLHDA